MGPANVRGMTAPGDVPPEVVGRLRPVCLAFPEAYEQSAWIGVRWRIRQRTFAHVFTVDPRRHQVYAAAAGTDQPVCVLTFRCPGSEIEALVAGGHPFFKATWGDDVVGMVLAASSDGDADGDVDWAEVAELLTESYLVLAPKKLAARVHGPPTMPDSGAGPRR